MSRESIWFGLDRFGLTPEEKATIMGNAQQESGNETDRVQGDFASDRRLSKEYTAMVDKGAIGRSEFINRGPNGGGYGWLQWTFWSRKAGLYDMAKGRGVSIGDEGLALDYMWQELQTSEFSGVLSMLKSDASLREKTVYWMVYFEKPADKSPAAQNIRVQYAEQILAEFAGKEPPEPEPPAEDTPDTVYWPPRVLCRGMMGTDVRLLQALLACHGYPCGHDGVADIWVSNMICAFQAEHGLAADAIAGPKTFQALGLAKYLFEKY